MSDQKVPTAPDYSPAINAFNSLAATAKANGADALNWAKGQVSNAGDLISKVNGYMTGAQGAATAAGEGSLVKGNANVDNATSDLIAQRARNRDPAQQASDAGASEANVGQAFDAAKQANTQELESYGVNPGATRFGALDIGVRTQRAAAQAGAGTVAARTDQALGDAANDKLLNAGNNQVTQGNSTIATGNASGTGAVNNNLAGTASGANVLGTDLAWTGAGTSALGGTTTANNASFGNQADADKIANSSSSGIGTALGAAAGTAATLMKLSTGGAIPDSASPTNGAATDDVPAVGPTGPARLNAGEFVLPKDVVEWKGQEFLQKLIMQARQAASGATAKPQMKPAVGAM